MKRFLLPLLFFAVTAISTAQTPRVNRTLMTQVERDLDQRIFRIWNDNPMAVVGTTRGVYLQGYGIVFSVEMNMVTPPGGGLMGAPLTEELKAEIHKKKIQRLPELKTALKDILVALAAQLDPIPANEQIVIAAILPRYTWEAADGVPIQLTAQAMKAELLALRGGTGAAGKIDAKAAPAAKSTRIPTGVAAKSAPAAATAMADAIKFSELN